MAKDPANPDATAVRRVAVIAVHGVADQQPGETVDAISGLLTNLEQDAAPAYRQVIEDEIQIPVRRFNPKPEHATSKTTSRTYSKYATFAERAPTLRKEEVDVSHEFMTSLLEGYEPSGPHETFHTKVARMSRVGDATHAEYAVDVFEMYWADLSRLTQSAFRMFAELYQLLFHFASLGVHAMTAAEADNEGKGDVFWKMWRRSQRIAAEALTLGFPITNLMLVALLLGMAANWMPAKVLVPAAIAGVGVALAGLVGLLSYRGRRPKAFATIAIGAVVAAAATGIFAYKYRLDLRRDWQFDVELLAHRLLVTETLIVAALVIARLVRAYERHRPGAQTVAAIVGFIVGVPVIWRLWFSGGSSVVGALLFGGEFAYACLGISLGVFLLFAILVFIFGALARWQGRNDAAASDRLSRMTWTTRLTLVLPAALFLLVTVSVWAGLWDAVAGNPTNEKLVCEAGATGCFARAGAVQATLVAPGRPSTDSTSVVLYITQDSGLIDAHSDSPTWLPASGPGRVYRVRASTAQGSDVVGAFKVGADGGIELVPEAAAEKFRAREFSVGGSVDVTAIDEPATSTDQIGTVAYRSTGAGVINHANLREPYRLKIGPLGDLVGRAASSTWKDEPHSAYTAVTVFVTAAPGFGYGVLVAMMILAILFAAYGFGPPILAEIRPGAKWNGRRLSTWLDDGFLLLRWGGRAIAFAVIVLLPIGMMLLMAPAWFGVTDTSWLWLYALNKGLIKYGGIVLMTTGAGLLAFGGRLKKVLSGFRNLLDVMLDVDNYLREHPRTSAPRAAQCARLASLMRHVYSASPKYDAVVIISHSQGTVLAADFLRYLHQPAVQAENPGVADDRPLRLFTMGSPLRQLYSLRFPHLYKWTRHSLPDDRPTSVPAAPLTAAQALIPDTQEPDPTALGLKQWVNVYRSADYVGRHLWRPDCCSFGADASAGDEQHPWQADPVPSAFVSADKAGTRREFCVGPGAHCHYWDETAPLVARELDTLIRA